MEQVNNLRELKMRKAVLRKRVRELEDNFNSELDFFRYGMMAAKTFTQWGGFATIGRWISKGGQTMGKALGRSLSQALKKVFSKPPLVIVIFLIGAALLYSLTGNNGTEELPASRDIESL